MDALYVGGGFRGFVRLTTNRAAIFRRFLGHPPGLPDKPEQPLQVFSAEEDVHQWVKDHVEGGHSAGVEVGIVVLRWSALINNGADLKKNVREWH